MLERYFHCKLCGFSSDQKGLILHYRLKHILHIRRTAVPCLYQDCGLSFTSFNAFHVHIHRDHNEKCRKGNLKYNLPSHLVCTICKGVSNTSKLFFRHIQKHLVTSETVSCPFINCNYSSRNPNSFRSHLNRKHPDYCGKSVNYFKEEICNLAQKPNTDFESDHNFPLYFDNSENTWVEETVEGFQEISHREIKEHIGLFLLQLQSIHQVPVRTIQDILRSFSEIHTLSQWKIYEIIKSLGVKHNLNQDICEELTREIHKSYPFYSFTLPKSNFKKLNDKNGELATQKLRQNYVQNNLPYVKPIEYALVIGMENIEHLFISPF